MTFSLGVMFSVRRLEYTNPTSAAADGSGTGERRVTWGAHEPPVGSAILDVQSRDGVAADVGSPGVSERVRRRPRAA